MSPLRLLASLLVVTVFAALALPACSSKLGPEDFCEAYAACFDEQQQLGPEFYESCVDATEQQLEALAGTPCEDAFEDVIDCLAGNMTCDDFGQSACRDESSDFAACQSGGGPFNPGQPGFD